MFGGFTKDEKYVFVIILFMLGLGYGAQQWWLQPQRLAVIPATSSAASLRDETTASLTTTPGRRSPSVKSPASNRIYDLNLATERELESLPGIGLSKARAIIEFRSQRGRFATVEALDEVPGFGKATVERLRPFLTVAAIPAATSAHPSSAIEIGNPSVAAQTYRTPPSQTAGSPRASLAIPSLRPHPQGLININTSNPKELEQLVGIGPALAQRIVDHRKYHGLYKSPQDLLKVKGIGPKKLANFRHQISLQ
jgi:competence protein ComEA